MQLKAVDKNPINHSDGQFHWLNVEDHFFQTLGKWSYRRDAITGHCWIDPRPADESIGMIYATYYTHGDNFVSSHESNGIWSQAMAWNQSRKLGYPASMEISWKAKLLAMMPTVADAAALEVLRIPASKKGRMLDIGCGSGGFLKKMKARGWEVVGMDPDENAAARLASSEGIPVFSSIADIEKNASGPFDIVVLSHVIEHLPDPVNTLRDINKLMNGKGELIVTTPNVAGLGARIFGRFWRGLEPPRHFNVFTPDSLKYALNAAGFDVKRCDTEVRLARSIWYLSYLARKGSKELEIHRGKNFFTLKIFGYVFQLVEAMLVKFNPKLGEELYCVGEPSKTGLSETAC